MGFTIYYRSTEPMDRQRASVIRLAADNLNEGRTWLSCEPLNFFNDDDDGRLSGGSKPAFQPHYDDVASAVAEGLPDGTVRDLVDALCTLSQQHGVDWELGHDGDPAPIGFIRRGVADDGLLKQIDALADVGAIIADFEGECGDDIDGVTSSGLDNPPADHDDPDGEEDWPPTIKMWPE